MMVIKGFFLQWFRNLLIKASASFAWSETLRLETLATRATQNKFGGSGIKNENMSDKEKN